MIPPGARLKDYHPRGSRCSRTSSTPPNDQNIGPVAKLGQPIPHHRPQPTTDPFMNRHARQTLAGRSMMVSESPRTACLQRFDSRRFGRLGNTRGELYNFMIEERHPGFEGWHPYSSYRPASATIPVSEIHPRSSSTGAALFPCPTRETLMNQPDGIPGRPTSNSFCKASRQKPLFHGFGKAPPPQTPPVV